MKRIGILLLSVVLMAGVLCGCSSGKSTSGSTQQTTVSGHHTEAHDSNHHS